MINKLIDEIYSALDHELYLAALALALILPDSCARVEYPTANNNTRYKNWYKQYIGGRLLNPDGLPDIDENVAYSLRCCFLHEGNPNIGEGHGIDKFELMFQKKVPGPDFEVLEDGSIAFYFKYFDMMGEDHETGQYFYRINVRSYCEQICECVSEYYEKNKDKFSFNYTIVDWKDVKS